MEFNGGTQVYTHGNLFVQGGWTLCAAPPGVGGGSHDVYIDAPAFWVSICGMDKVPFFLVVPSSSVYRSDSPPLPAIKCAPLFAGNATNKPYSIYHGDYSTIVLNSTGTARALDTSTYFCGKSLDQWRQLTGGDAHTSFVDPTTVHESYTPADVVAKARAMLFP